MTSKRRTDRPRRALQRTLFALALLTALAQLSFVPLADALHEARLRDGALAFYAGLNAARMRAVERNQRIVMCPRATPTAAHCGVAADWTHGWLMFTAVPGSSRTGEFLDSGGGPAAGIAIRALGGHDVVTFLPDGRVKSSRSIAFELREPGSRYAIRRVTLSQQGSLRLAVVTQPAPAELPSMLTAQR